MIYYSTLVFEDAGLSKSVAQYATAGTGAVNVGWTFVSAALMDRLGRRTLMISGLGGMLVFTVVLTVALVFQVRGRHASLTKPFLFCTQPFFFFRL